MAEVEAQKWSQRGYESTEIALRYIEYRPKPPTKLSDRIVEYLKEKVSIFYEFNHRNFYVFLQIYQIIFSP